MPTAAEHQSKPIAAQIRTERGSRKSQELRANHLIPAIVYGHGQEPIAISVPTAQTESILRSGAHVADISIDGKVEKVLIKAVQYDYLGIQIEHLDFLRIDPNQRVTVAVSLNFRGVPKGTKEGGILETQMTEIEVDVLATAIPSEIRVNVEDLALNAILHAKDIQLPKGAKLIDNPEAIVCSVRAIKEEVAEVDAAATSTEPEVIGKKKEEEGAEGAADAKGGAKPAAKK